MPIALCATLFLSSCQISTDEGPVLAQVKEKRLLLRDVLELMPVGISSIDSASFVREYTENWVNEELIYQQGINHLGNYRELMQQVKQYERSLISQSYERALLETHEQDVSDEECEAFYAFYGNQMKLEEPIIKGFYVKIPADKKKQKSLKDWLVKLQKGDTDIMEELEQYCQLRAVDYDVFLEQWHPLSFVADRLPEQVVDASSFLKVKLYEMNDEEFDYLFLATDFRLEGENAPFEYILPEIRPILVNKRRRELLKSIYQEMRQQALESGTLIINE